ncbi:MAG: MerR family transcriptional regulator [Prevotellaceae bacterium]|jgi:DNA-binding transcriptional MerR regulator|nr:MerR family transcriptional regulator [Prevotellaceae bacterium]
MPYKEVEIEKIYYTIGEVAKMLGESTSLVRFWSNKLSDVIRPHKNRKGNRLFQPDDVENFKILHRLIKTQGMTLEGARKRLKENKSGEEYNMQIIDTLQIIKKELLEVKELL